MLYDDVNDDENQQSMTAINLAAGILTNRGAMINQP